MRLRVWPPAMNLLYGYWYNKYWICVQNYREHCRNNWFICCWNRIPFVQWCSYFIALTNDYWPFTRRFRYLENLSDNDKPYFITASTRKIHSTWAIQMINCEQKKCSAFVGIELIAISNAEETHTHTYFHVFYRLGAVKILIEIYTY